MHELNIPLSFCCSPVCIMQWECIAGETDCCHHLSNLLSIMAHLLRSSSSDKKKKKHKKEKKDKKDKKEKQPPKRS